MAKSKADTAERHATLKSLQRRNHSTQLKTAMENCKYDVNKLTYIIGIEGSTYASNSKTGMALDFDHTVAHTLARKHTNTQLHVHTTFLRADGFYNGALKNRQHQGLNPQRVNFSFHWLLF